MKTITQSFKFQQGVASLLTAIVLLICITLIVIFTSRSVLMETKMSADDYRTSQATAAAQAAMDRAVAYYGVSNSIDRINNTTIANATDNSTIDNGTVGSPDGIVDYSYNAAQMPSATNCNLPARPAATTPPTPVPFHIRLSSGSQVTLAQFYFDNTPGNICGNPTPVRVDRALITAIGWSDDCTAVHTITQCVDKGNIMKEKGPGQPFVSHGSIGIAGNATFINRFTNSNVWTGGTLGVADAAFATYVRPFNKNKNDLSWEQLTADCVAGGSAGTCNEGADPDQNTRNTDNLQLASNKAAGYSVDIIGSDPSLGNLTNDEVWDLFFEDPKDAIKATAQGEGQYFTGAVAQAFDKSGLIWIEGNADLGGQAVIGDVPDVANPPHSAVGVKPAILVVNGNLSIGAGVTIYGIVYVTGDISISGSPTIYGSIIGEQMNPTRGQGTPTIIYVPWFGGDSPNQPPGPPAPVPGSWKDW